MLSPAIFCHVRLKELISSLHKLCLFSCQISEKTIIISVDRKKIIHALLDKRRWHLFEEKELFLLPTYTWTIFRGNVKHKTEHFLNN
jgi:hypothetical protein